jgi:hypothetical protein
MKGKTTTIAVALFLMAAWLTAQAGRAEAKDPHSCSRGQAGKLRPTDDGGDLTIQGKDCLVQAGTYKFGNVYIVEGGTLRFDDANIDFWASNILVENGGTLRIGTKDAPVGSKDIKNKVVIHLYGADKGANGKGVVCKTAHCGIPDAIWSTNGASKVNTNATEQDYFYQYEPLFYDGGNPDGYFGYKVLGLSYGGTLEMYGKKGAVYGTEPASSDSGTSWLRLMKSVGSTDQELVVEARGRESDWQEGDEIVLTSTDYVPGHSEKLKITGPVVSNRVNNVVVSWTIPVGGGQIKWHHNGEKYDFSRVPAGIGADLPDRKAETRAAVALLSRSIVIKSGGADIDNPLEDSSFIGGHTIVRQGFKSFKVQGVEFYQLGQGGRLGHYPVHWHMARKTPADTFLKDSSIWDSMTRWVVLHATHGVTVARNVGYLSIGHGYYLEEGSEIDNRFLGNIGIYARAAVQKSDGTAQKDNPKKVPGILAAARIDDSDNVPFHTDVDHPTLFWIMNGWNDFEYNMAVGAGTCGFCYWFLPGANSGMSRHMKWEGYASMQMWDTEEKENEFPLQRQAMTPLRKFVGNFCSTAMNSFNVVGNTTPCNGVGIPRGETYPHLTPIVNTLAPPSCKQDNPRQLPPNSDKLTPDACGRPLDKKPGDDWPNRQSDDYYPKVSQGGGHFPTLCDQTDCSGPSVSRCDKGDEKSCTIIALDKYTSSFHWTELNVGAVWLRPQWYLFINSFLSDVQHGGLSFVTGGGYTLSDAPKGHWALARKSVFVGNTQNGNPYASNAGPFSKGGLKCDSDNPSPLYCLSQDEALSFPSTPFGVNQRLFNIYDGPSFQESNAYLDITKTVIDDCQPSSAAGVEHKCTGSAWMYGRTIGMPVDEAKTCYLPNAAIAWKQPNGFYYPPAFHSHSLFFDPARASNVSPDSGHYVDIRHFVIVPEFLPRASEKDKIYSTDPSEVRKRYCTWREDMFGSFTDIDRQTELNDDDGSLTGYVNTISVNEDPFFRAPVEAFECQSDVTAKTSPYDYASTVVYPACKEGCGLIDKNPPTSPNDTEAWSVECSNHECFGVPLYRQYRTGAESKTEAHSIKMAGQSKAQRSNLTVNGGKYYIDTTVSRDTQRTAGANFYTVFQNSKTYYVFLLFAKPSTRQTYQLYVGKNFNLANDVQGARVTVDTAPYNFDDKAYKDSPWLDAKYGADGEGILTVTIDLKDQASIFAATAAGRCGPAGFCKANGAKCECALKPGDYLYEECAADNSAICSWAIKDFPCPDGGCFGFAFTLPTAAADFTNDDNIAHKPATVCFPTTTDPLWKINFTKADTSTVKGACTVPDPVAIPACTD